MEAASLDEKKQMWSILSVEIAMCEVLCRRTISDHTDLTDDSASPVTDDAPPTQPVVPAATTGHMGSQDAVSEMYSFVDHVQDLGIDQTLEQGILSELSSLKLLSTSKKVKTQWLSPTNDKYKYGNVCNNPKPINGFPCIAKLMDIVNAHPSTTRDSDACIVSCFSSSKAFLSLHKDNEALMSQTSSISTVSFGAPRKLQFVRDGKHRIDGKRDLTADIELDASHLTMNIMKPGAQSIMKHRVPAGDHVPDMSNVRYSLSFRKIISQSANLNQTVLPSEQQVQEKEKSAPPTPMQPVILVAGDSFAARLDAKRLGKGKIKVINVAEGGLKISAVQKNIEEFVRKNTQYDVQKVILSIGTNDIRHCKDGIKHLKNTICDFMKFLKITFPSASIYFQSIIPLAHNNCPHVTSNVLDMNKLIYNLCSKFHLYYLDVFRSFLNHWGYRNDRLFPEFDAKKLCFDIHPNVRGMGVLARRYIYIIHSRWFNPLGY